MIMSGSREATIQAIHVVNIHGSIFYDLVYTLTEGDTQQRQTRVGQESIYAGAKPGDRVRIIYLMNVVTGVEQRG